MIRRLRPRRQRKKYKYTFRCAECDRMQEIHDNRRRLYGDYCTACLERAGAGEPSPIHRDDETSTVYCDCFTPIIREEGT